MGGLWKPTDHEKSAAKDKARKADYRENFTLRVSQVLSWTALSSIGLRLGRGGRLVRTSAWYRDFERCWKGQIKSELRLITNRYPIVVRGYKYAFDWTVRMFVEQNSIEAEGSQQLFNEVRVEAGERREIVEKKVMRSEFHHEKVTDRESGEEADRFELSLTYTDIKGVFEFADNLRIEEEFFAERPK